MTRARRFRRAGVTALSVWDLPTDAGLLWERLGAPRLLALRARGRPEAEITAELAASAADALRRLRDRHGCTRAFLGGGLTELAGFAEALQDRADVPFACSEDGRFAGEAGGWALLRERGHAAGVVVDVGQTAVKASRPGRRLVRERDTSELPLELIDPSHPPPPRPERLERVAGFVGGAVAELLEHARPAPRALVLALPCPLDDRLVPGGCTYGWQGEGRLVPAILERAGRDLDLVLVLNDAELLAETARARAPAAPGERVLALTLGFGPGAALIDA